MDRVVLVHYGEIGVKGGNRAVFERRLQGNCRRALLGTGAGTVRRRPGRLEVVVPEGADAAGVCTRLQCVPGIVWIALAEPVPRDLAAITARIVALAVAEAAPADAPFRIVTKRSDKAFQPDSMEVSRHVGQAVANATGRPVDLDAPVSTYGVEINEDGALVFTARLEGVGGLPVGTAGPVVALLSGGLDSPVAAWRLQRRGCPLVVAHFRNETLAGGRAVERKIRDLGAVLARGQGTLRLWLVPFGDLQRQIVANVPDRFRMLAYRRVMLRLAERIAVREGAGGLVVGDSLGQVASQTLDNLHAVWSVARLPVLAPLIGHDKSEIMAEARRIGTHDISIRPHEDCCSYLVPAHPETAAEPADLDAVEGFLTDALYDAALAATTPEIVAADLAAHVPGPVSNVATTVDAPR
jgi:thiamine biosynthesis protein ThiI